LNNRHYLELAARDRAALIEKVIEKFKSLDAPAKVIDALLRWQLEENAKCIRCRANHAEFDGLEPDCRNFCGVPSEEV
jgi:hypothetical protein